MEPPGDLGDYGEFYEKQKYILGAFRKECSLICFRNLAFVSLSR